MRSCTVALLGLAALASALPVEERQTFEIVSDPAANPVTLVPGTAVPEGGAIVPNTPEAQPAVQITRRWDDDVLYWFPDSDKSDKQNIIKAELQLQELDSILRTTTDRHEKKAVEACIKSIQAWLKKVAGITKIEAPPGITTTFTPGKREEAIGRLQEAYFILIKPYTKGVRPDLATYLIILQYQNILRSHGIQVEDTFLLGPISTTIGPATKRQVFNIGSCREQDIVGLRATLTSLLIIYGRNPPYEIWNLEQAIIAALKACKQDIDVGTITPGPYTPGGPLVPETTTSGGTITPETTTKGGSITPETTTKGGEVKPST